MILVDTSVWVDHLRVGNDELVGLLDKAQVLVHPFVVGELACGYLHNRTEVLSLLQQLPQAPVATDAEVLFFIERHRLMGTGIGYIDAHLASTIVLGDSFWLWTYDKRLKKLAGRLEKAYLFPFT